MNSFQYSSDNKHYHTFNYDLRKRYGDKTVRVSLNTGLSCPNRDGTCGIGGCSFCNAIGSGDFGGLINDDLETQYIKGKAQAYHKWPQAKIIAYFQSYSNTYAPLDKLKTLFEPFIQKDEVIALAIATRADCLSLEIIEYLDSLSKIKDIYLELGLQSIHDETAKHMNRGHDYALFKEVYTQLQSTNLKVIIHIINGYPSETKEMMIETVKEIAKLHPYGIKIHMLNVLKDTRLATQYDTQNFELMSQDDYEDLVIQQLRLLPSDIVIVRLTGDGDSNELIAPLWITNKVSILNHIDQKMAKDNLYQGDQSI